MTSNIWGRIKTLEGKTLRTVSRGHLFDVHKVDDERIYYDPQGTTRPGSHSSFRTTFEQLAALNLKPSEWSLQRVKETIPQSEAFCASYIFAILCEIGVAQPTV